LLRNWENLTATQKGVIRDLKKANTRSLRAWQLKEELREIMSMPLAKARRALDDWLHFASRSRLEPFVKLARTVRHYRESSKRPSSGSSRTESPSRTTPPSGRLRANARGFHDPQSCITMIMLDRAGIAPSLPWPS
jgi:transposase